MAGLKNILRMKKRGKKKYRKRWKENIDSNKVPSSRARNKE